MEKNFGSNLPLRFQRTSILNSILDFRGNDNPSADRNVVLLYGNSLKYWHIIGKISNTG